MRALTRSALVFTAAILTALSLTPARAQPASDFYRGKTISLYVSSTAGSVYDLYARLLSRHMGRHLPGNPRMVVMNMEGAGGLRLANFLYNGAPKDGTAIGTINRGAPFEPLLGVVEAARFDATRFNWIGSANDEVSTCVAWKTAGITRFDELFAREITVGSTGGTADSHQFPMAISNILGARIKIVSGYLASDIELAMQRGEVEGRCGWSWSGIAAAHRTWVDDGSLKILVQLALNKHPDLPDVPLILDFAKTDEQRQMLRLIFVRAALGAPFLAPPGLPPERAAQLRRAFDATMADPAFLAEARRSSLEIAPVSGADLERLIAEVYRTPADVVAKTKAVLR
jgi:tripartite-type tricarboxylate transporter receptor subunit TctC